MAAKTATKNQLCKRLSAIGIRQNYVHAIIAEFQKWNSESGSEWTISRLKSLKVAYFNALSGNPSWPEWVAMSSDGFPKGTLGRLMKVSLETMSAKHIQRTISTLMVYSQLISQEITEKQWKKFQSSVEKKRPECLMQVAEQYSEILVQPSLHISKGYNTLDWKVNSGTREPIMDSLLNGIGKTQPEDGTELLDGFKHPLVQQYFYDGIHSFSPFGKIDDSIPHLDMMTMAVIIKKGFEISKEQSEPYPPVGKIGFIQEAGYKLRAVANPHRIFQFLLDPLKRSLLNKLSQLESDCTHSQENGVDWAQKALINHISISSVDLSDATNNFPLVVQMHMLKSMYKDNNELLDLFEMVSKSPWLVHDPLTGRVREMVWTTGQPLGLGPSFPAFAAAHHMIMWEVISKVETGSSLKGRLDYLSFMNGNKSKALNYCDKYRILGDDIVMHSTYEKSYIEKLNSMDMPVSKDKTITSPNLAEFASRVITRDNIFIQNKWKIPSDRNFLALAKNLGPQSLGLFRPKQQKVIKKLASLPEWEGGLGWNPKGLSAQTRIAAYKPFLENKNAEEADLYTRRETLTLEKAKLLFGDDITYEWIKPIHSSISSLKTDNAAAHPVRTRSGIDYIHSIHHEKAFSPLDVPKDKVPFSLTRENGDPRGASVLEHFNKVKVQDVLKASNDTLKYLESLKGTPQEHFIKEFSDRMDQAVYSSTFNAAFVSATLKDIKDKVFREKEGNVVADIFDSYSQEFDSQDSDEHDMYFRK